MAGEKDEKNYFYLSQLAKPEMKKTFLLFLLTSVFWSSCKKSRGLTVTKINWEQIVISDSIPANDSIAAFIGPYKKHIDQEMNAVLAYAPIGLTKTDDEFNTAIGNMMADAVMELANPVFEQRTGESIDIVLLNYGGIRSSLSKGDVSTRTAYQIMPFENEVVVAELRGEQVREMVRYLIDDGSAHPVAGLELAINLENAIERMLVQGKPVEEDKIYYVATNDYLYQGGDNMLFFAKAEGVHNLDYKIRNVLIDYFSQKDTIAPVRDQRFIRIP